MGYHNISYLINASIYLVKGGRLGLMPGVWFHSCRPSFRHTGVMFLDFASCHAYVMVVYHVVCFFSVVLLLDSSCFVAIMRIRSTTPVRLLHGFVLLPSGISGKMTVTLDLITIIAMLAASFYRYAAPPIHLLFKPPKLP